MIALPLRFRSRKARLIMKLTAPLPTNTTLGPRESPCCPFLHQEGNIYGLVFGSKHWLGLYKFVQEAWRIDPENGEADYEIEVDAGQGDLLTRTFKRRRVEVFADNLADRIENREFKADGDVALHCIVNGILPSKAATPALSLIHI